MSEFRCVNADEADTATIIEYDRITIDDMFDNNLFARFRQRTG